VQYLWCVPKRYSQLEDDPANVKVIVPSELPPMQIEETTVSLTQDEIGCSQSSKDCQSYDYKPPKQISIKIISDKTLKQFPLMNRFFTRGVCFGTIVIPGRFLPNNSRAFVITLYTTPIRTARAISALQSKGYGGTICIMNPPDDPTYSEYLTTSTKKPMTKGELGCLASHSWVLTYAASHSNEFSVILEDDCDMLTTIDSATDSWNFVKQHEFCMLGCSDWHLQKRDISDLGFYTAQLSTGRACGTFAYSVTSRSALKLACKMQSFPLFPADHAIQNVWSDICVLFPPMFIADRTTTSIEGHEQLSKTYSERCLQNVELKNYSSVQLSLLSTLECECWINWPDPINCKRCFRTLLVRQFQASKWTRNQINQVTRVALGVHQFRGCFVLPAPLRSLRPKLPQDIAIAMAFFNPCGYKRPIQNIIKCATQFSPLPVYILELGNKNLFLNQKLFNTSGIRLHQVKSESVMFHKENLWMKIHDMIPKTIRKIIFLDADILLRDPLAWVSRVSAILDTYDIVQPLSVIKFQENAEGTRTSSQALLVASSKVRQDCFDKRFSYPSPGYGIAVQRSWLMNVGGLVQTAVVGAGDLFMLGGLLHPQIVQDSIAYKSSPFAWSDTQRFLSEAKRLQTKVSYVAQEGLHLYHGSRENRQYSTRHEDFRSLTLKDLRFNKERVLEFKHPEKWNIPMLKYFAGRKEDQ
jgi:hypothetical protein